jgi:hypothetical protein
MEERTLCPPGVAELADVVGGAESATDAVLGMASWLASVEPVEPVDRVRARVESRGPDG